MRSKNTNLISAVTASIIFFFLGAEAAGMDHSPGPYVRASRNYISGAVRSQPQFSPAHPVTSTHVFPSNDEADLSNTLAFGYISRTGLFVDIGFSDLGTFSRTRRFSGSDVSLSYDTISRLDESAKTIELKLGKSFRITRESAFYVEGGAHRYSVEADETAQTFQTPIPSGTTIDSVARRHSTRTSTSAMYGIGLSLIPTEAFSMRVGLSRYEGIKRTAFSVGLTIAVKPF